MKIGKYNLRFIQTGLFALDGGAMFGIIPKPLWEKSNPPDEKNRIKLGAKSILLESDSRKILVDTGIGSNWDEKFLKIYDVQFHNNNLFDELNKVNIKPDEITDVILTHLHFDHTGGSVIEQNGKMIPAFPNADYHVQKEHFDWALNPSDRDRGSFIKNRFIHLAEEGILNFINDKYFDDEIEFIKVYGHTIGMQLIKIFDSSNTILYCADLVPTSSHVPVPYVMGYDIQPLNTVKEKNELFPMAVEEEWKLIFEHDPKILAATINKTEKGYSLKETFEKL
ncbi:MAG: MBL fold metallo-hydrolase [Melioribacteraceae bacterium]|nr:MBL fold metallo-hydrolase [Melioribacteraceae bacterium]